MNKGFAFFTTELAKSIHSVAKYEARWKARQHSILCQEKQNRIFFFLKKVCKFAFFITCQEHVRSDSIRMWGQRSVSWWILTILGNTTHKKRHYILLASTIPTLVSKGRQSLSVDFSMKVIVSTWMCFHRKCTYEIHKLYLLFYAVNLKRKFSNVDGTNFLPYMSHFWSRELFLHDRAWSATTSPLSSPISTIRIKCVYCTSIGQLSSCIPLRSSFCYESVARIVSKESGILGYMYYNCFFEGRKLGIVARTRFIHFLTKLPAQNQCFPQGKRKKNESSVSMCTRHTDGLGWKLEREIENYASFGVILYVFLHIFMQW